MFPWSCINKNYRIVSPECCEESSREKDENLGPQQSRHMILAVPQTIVYF